MLTNTADLQDPPAVALRAAPVETSADLGDDRALPGNLAAALRRQQLPALDGFRAVAAFLVVFYHAGLPVSGGLGVLGFFVLSGFLITWLLLKEDDRYGSISVKKFYARRSLRIFPAFYCYWLLVIALGLVIHKPIGSGQAWSSFFYFNNYYQAIVSDPNSSLSHTWSLAIEEQFYLLWPFTFLLFRRSRSHLLRVLTIVIVGVWVWRVTATLYFHVPQGYRYEAFDMRMDHLAIGCWLAVALREGYFPRVWRGLCASAILPLVTCLALAGSMILALRLGPIYRDTVGGIVDPLLIAILLTQLLAFHDNPAWRAFNWRWVSYLGRISYSVYLYQQIAISPAKRILGAWPFPVQVGGAVILVIVLASLSYYVIEQPFIRLKKTYSR